MAARAGRDFCTDITASKAGQLLHQMGITTVMSRGKPRLVLDPAVLKTLRDELAAACNEKAIEAAKVLAVFNTVSANIKAVEDRWQEILRLRNRERELVQRLQEESAKPNRVPQLEQRRSLLQEQANKGVAIEKECQELEEKPKAMPSVQPRRDAVGERLRQYQQEELRVAADEARLGQVLTDLKMRSAWVTYVDLDRNIQQQRAELEQLSQQLAEKRSLWQRMFGPKDK